MLELNCLYNFDCMDGMKQFPDKYFQLAIIDPPFGGAGKDFSNGENFDERFDKHKPDISVHRTGGGYAAKYGKTIIEWDIAPGQEYFDELFRVSENQIIFGGNYFSLPPTRCFVVWDKHIPENFTMAMCEYVWTSFNRNAKIVRIPPYGECGNTSKYSEKRFHATQKPIKLYTWLLNQFAKTGDKILDTHVGSASLLIACYRAGYEYCGFEINEDYYKKAQARIENEKLQVRLEDIE